MSISVKVNSSTVSVTQIPVHRRDRGCASEEFNDRFRGGSLSAQPAQPALDSAPDSLADVFGRFQVESVMSEFDIFVFLNRRRRGLSHRWSKLQVGEVLPHQ